TEYEGIGHNVWSVTDDAVIARWLLAQRQNSGEHAAPDVELSLQGSVEDGKLELSWNVEADETNLDNRLWYTKVYRDGSLIAEVEAPETTYTDSLISPNATYLYNLIPVNYYFKEGEPTSQITIHYD